MLGRGGQGGRGGVERPDGSKVDTTGVQFGLMNALKTGNMILDTLICLLIPALLPLLQNLGGVVGVYVYSWYKKYFNSEYAIRVVSTEYGPDVWGRRMFLSMGDRNDILQKAIKVYLSHLKVKLSECDVTFVEKGDSRRDQNRFISEAERVKAFTFNRMPSNDQWAEVIPGLFVSRFERQTSNDPNQNNKTQSNAQGSRVDYYLKAKNPNGEEKIDSFLQTCIDWYIKDLESLNDDNRYLYVLQNKVDTAGGGGGGLRRPGGGRDEEVDGFRFKRYKLGDYKTFRNLFIKEKHDLVKLLGQFSTRTGKYAIQGYPHKLGLLLHGPPGTGKTSLIKALGHETKRAIVSIDLCKISTNQELFDIVFDQSYIVAGRDFPVNMAYDEVIFVMEDIDAATDIVLSRKSETQSSKDESEVKAEALMEVLDVLADKKETDVKEETVDKQDEEKIGNEKSGGKKTKGEKKEGSSNSIEEDVGIVSLFTSSKKKADEEKEKKSDKLNLSGLLNVLDGIVDTPGRLLVMTSNHPDKLDDALTRPGRIDKVIKLGYLEAEEAIDMVKYYFPDELMTFHQEEQISRLVSGHGLGPNMCFSGGVGNPAAKRFTPAELEQHCAEHDDIDDLIEHCKKLIHHFVEMNLPPGIRRQVSVGGTVRYVNDSDQF